MVALIFALTLPMNVANSAIFRRKPLDRSIAVACVLGVIGCATVFWNDIADFTWSAGSLTFTGIALGSIAALLIYHGMRALGFRPGGERPATAYADPAGPAPEPR